MVISKWLLVIGSVMYAIICLFPLPREIAERYLSGDSPESENVRKITYEFISKNMQNKANFRKAKMNVTVFYTKEYENIANWKLCENKPNTNPIKPNTNPISPPHAAKQTQYKPKQSQFQMQKNVFGAPKILTINKTVANLKNRIAFSLFLERTLFGR